MKKALKLILILLAVIAVGFLVTVYFVRSTGRWIDTVTWEEPSLQSVEDGVYTGSASFDMPTGTASANTAVTVRVTVKNHRYESVEIVDPKELVQSMTPFAETVVTEQTVHPDAVSGGTVTKTLVLMAVVDAVSRE
jgi:uncharacterized protein with FMN-binding domain